MTGMGEGCGGRDGRRMLAQGQRCAVESAEEAGGRAAEGLVNGIKIKSSGMRRISLH